MATPLPTCWFLSKGIQGAPTAAVTCSYIVIQWLLAVFLGRNVPHLERASNSAESRNLRTGRQTPQWVPGSNDEESRVHHTPKCTIFWHMSYFELKLFKKQPANKGHSEDPPLSPESKKSISCEVTLCTKTAGIFIIRVGNSRHKRLYILSLLQ